MTNFRVWAPTPGTVALHLSGHAIPMPRDEDGWWQVEAAAPAGTDYGYSLDGGPPLPDPRSPFQPDGVHGLSRTVDHSSFPWSDGGWQPPPLSSAVIYELHTGTFTPEGTFEGIIDKLDYLRGLGVTHVELMPVNEFSGDRGWGYDGVDLYAPHHAYGGPDGLKRLVNACHGRGLAVLLDVVYNHLGPTGNYLGRYGPYFSDRYKTPWGDAVNFDGPESHHVRRFFCDNALMWLRDYHFDGLRIDAVHAILDTSAVHILEQLALEVEELSAHLGRHFVLIPESDLNDPRLLLPRGYGGYGLDAQWSDDFHHAIHSVLTGERAGYYADFGGLEHLAEALTHAYVYAGVRSPFRRRVHGRPATGLSGHRFLGYAQNHDQVGNRARGERLSQLAGPGRLKVAAALVLCSPFVPMLFMGEEWGAGTPFQYFTDHREPELAQAVARGRAQEFQEFGWRPEEIPNPQDLATFERSRLDWSEPAGVTQQEMIDWYRALVDLRRRTPALTDGRLERVDVQWDEAAQWLVLHRGPVSVVVNLAGAQPIPVRATGILLASHPETALVEGAVSLPEDSVAILQQ